MSKYKAEPTTAAKIKSKTKSTAIDSPKASETDAVIFVGSLDIMTHMNQEFLKRPESYRYLRYDRLLEKLDRETNDRIIIINAETSERNEEAAIRLRSFDSDNNIKRNKLDELVVNDGKVQMIKSRGELIETNLSKFKKTPRKNKKSISTNDTATTKKESSNDDLSVLSNGTSSSNNSPETISSLDPSETTNTINLLDTAPNNDSVINQPMSAKTESVNPTELNMNTDNINDDNAITQDVKVSQDNSSADAQTTEPLSNANTTKDAAPVLERKISSGSVTSDTSIASDASTKKTFSRKNSLSSVLKGALKIVGANNTSFYKSLGSSKEPVNSHSNDSHSDENVKSLSPIFERSESVTDSPVVSAVEETPVVLAVEEAPVVLAVEEAPVVLAVEETLIVPESATIELNKDNLKSDNNLKDNQDLNPIYSSSKSSSIASEEASDEDSFNNDINEFIELNIPKTDDKSKNTTHIKFTVEDVGNESDEDESDKNHYFVNNRINDINDLKNVINNRTYNNANIDQDQNHNRNNISPFYKENTKDSLNDVDYEMKHDLNSPNSNRTRISKLTTAGQSNAVNQLSHRPATFYTPFERSCSNTMNAATSYYVCAGFVILGVAALLLLQFGPDAFSVIGNLSPEVIMNASIAAASVAAAGLGMAATRFMFFERPLPKTKNPSSNFSKYGNEDLEKFTDGPYSSIYNNNNNNNNNNSIFELADSDVNRSILAPNRI